MTSYVYFFQHRTLPLVKIGKANNWMVRASQVGGTELIDIERSFIKHIDTESHAYDVERMLHKIFYSFRVDDPTGLSGGTEWFEDSIIPRAREILGKMQYAAKPKRVKPTDKWRSQVVTIIHMLTIHFEWTNLEGGGVALFPHAGIRDDDDELRYPYRLAELIGHDVKNHPECYELTGNVWHTLEKHRVSIPS
jgi:hypothetical protein